MSIVIDYSPFLRQLNREGELRGQWMSVEQWRQFRVEQERLTTPEMEQVTQQVSDVLEGLYVHRMLKAKKHHANAAAALKKLDREVVESPPEPAAFHERMLHELKRFNDVHTAYRLPNPARKAIAFLPFMIKPCVVRERGRHAQKYVVTHTVGGAIQWPEFSKGVEVETWDDQPMKDAVRRSATSEEGATLANDLALGLQFMTIRWLAASFEPPLDPVRVGFRLSEQKDLVVCEFLWTVFVPEDDLQIMVTDQAASAVFAPAGARRAAERAVNVSSQLVHSWRRKMFRPDAEVPSPEEHADWKAIGERLRTRFGQGYMGRSELNRFSREASLLPVDRAQVAPGFREVPSLLPLFLEASQYSGRGLLERLEPLGDDADPPMSSAEQAAISSSDYGYIRIRAFPLKDPDRLLFKYELVRLLALMRGDGLTDHDGLSPCAGLVIDVRDNVGGSTRLAEESLQFFTPRKIDPMEFRFAASEHTLKIANLPEYQGYRASIEQALAERQPFSAGMPITDPISANVLGQHFFGPVVLITSGSTYSAAEIFAAGFEDNGVGLIIGVDDTTGGGGSNCWFYRDEIAPILGLDPLAADANLQVAVREGTRGTGQDARSIEEVGIPTNTDNRYRMTKNDVLEKQPWGLLLESARKLAVHRAPRVDVDVSPLKNAQHYEVSVTTTGIDRLEYSLNGGAPKELTLEDGRAHVFFDVDLGVMLEIRGFAARNGRENLVARFAETFWA